VVALGAIELVVDVVLRDGVDLEAELDDEHARLVRGGRSAAEDEGRGDRDRKCAQKATFHERKDCIWEGCRGLTPSG
jgi:hypothetical protein